MSRQTVEEWAFRQLALDREDRICPVCGGGMHIRSRRSRCILTLDGPLQLRVGLVQCYDERCEQPQTLQSRAGMRYRHATLGNRLGRLLPADVQESLARIAASGEVGPAFSLPDDKIYHGMAKMMTSFQVGLFAGTDLTCFPQDNLDIERWFRGSKSHERRVHGHKHAGIRIVREGATLIPTPDAHTQHPGFFTEQDLTQFAAAAAPARQLASQQRHGVMKKARSKKIILLKQLEKRLLNPSD